MIRPEDFFSNLEDSRQQRLGQIILVASGVKQRQPLQGICVVRMFSAHCFAIDAHRLPKQIFCLRSLSSLLNQIRQCLQRLSDLLVICSKQALPRLQRSLQQRRRLIVGSGGGIQLTQIVLRLRSRQVWLRKFLLTNLECLEQQRLGLNIVV